MSLYITISELDKEMLTLYTKLSNGEIKVYGMFHRDALMELEATSNPRATVDYEYLEENGPVQIRGVA